MILITYSNGRKDNRKDNIDRRDFLNVCDHVEFQVIDHCLLNTEDSEKTEIRTKSVQRSLNTKMTLMKMREMLGMDRRKEFRAFLLDFVQLLVSGR